MKKDVAFRPTVDAPCWTQVVYALPLRRPNVARDSRRRRRPVDARDWLLHRGRRAVVWGGFTLLILFGVLFLLRDALKYLDWTPTAYQRFWPQRWALAAHALTAGVCLLLRFNSVLASAGGREPAHRTIGWAYVLGALASAALTVRLGFFSACRMCIPPFVIWSVLFFIVTALGVVMAVRRQFYVHRQFMIRSWVLMNGFVFVRLDTHFPYPLPTGPDIDRPAMLIWAAWVVPLILTEMLLNWTPLVARALAASKRAVAT